MSFPFLDELRAALRADVGGLVESFRGPRNADRSSSRQWRWGKNGSLAADVSGAHCGRICDFEDGQGFDPIGFIQHERHCDFAEAVRWAASRYGFDLGAESRPEDPTAAARPAAAREEKRLTAEAAEAT